MSRRRVTQATVTADVEKVLSDNPTASANAVSRQVRHRRSDVLRALRELRDPATTANGCDVVYLVPIRVERQGGTSL